MLATCTVEALPYKAFERLASMLIFVLGIMCARDWLPHAISLVKRAPLSSTWPFSVVISVGTPFKYFVCPVMLGKAPNITGKGYDSVTSEGVMNEINTNLTNSALYCGNKYTSWKGEWANGGQHNSYTLSLDASRSNSIYKSTTVQVPSLKILYLIKI